MTSQTYNRNHSSIRRIRSASFIVFSIAALTVATIYWGPQAYADDEKFQRAAKPIAGRYIVVLNEDKEDGTKLGSSAEIEVAADALTAASGGEKGDVFSEAIKGFALSADENEALMISLDPQVKYVVEDDEMEANGIQTYVFWNLDRIDQRTGTDAKYVYPLNGAGSTVYVVDTGIKTSHVEFGGRARVGFDAIGDGQNGNDCNGHGTHVASTAVGEHFGVAKNANAVAVRVLNCQGIGSASGLIAGIDWIIRNRTPRSIANMSLGFGGINSAVDTAVANLVASGVPTVVAAGNSYGADASNFSPARVASAITVGASNSSDTRAVFSNVGSAIDIFAPGEDVWAASIYFPGGISYSGTSMAAPHVAGFLAQVYNLFPVAGPADLDYYLKVNASPGVIRDAGVGTTANLLYTFVVNHCGLLKAHQTLFKNQYVDSCSGSARLIFQSDGNLVLYNRNTGRALWHTRTGGRPEAHVVQMQGDGNFVLYDNRYRPMWNSSTARRPGAFLRVQDDNNMVIYNDVGETALWQTRTSGR